MRIMDKEPYVKNFFGITSNSGRTFITFSFIKPSFHTFQLLTLRFEKDIAIPAFEISFTLMNFTIFFRMNFKESDEVFERFNKQIEEIMEGDEYDGKEETRC